MSDSDPVETVSYSHTNNLQVYYNVLSFTLVIFLLRTHPNVRLDWHFLCQVLSLTCSKPKADYHPLSGIRWLLNISFWLPSTFARPFLPSTSSGSAIPLWQVTIKGKGIPLEAWSGPEGSRKLRFPDYMTTAPDGYKVVSLTHRSPLPPGNTPGTHFC